MIGYYEFADRVRFENRYVLDEPTREFLEHLAEEANERQAQIAPAFPLWRAQINRLEDCEKISADADPLFVPLPPERMVPESHHVSDGRINPRGIAYLYLADSRETAIAEVRPPIDARVTIAEFHVAKPVTVIDCRMGASDSGSAAWGDLDNALSVPADREETWSSYLPTQCFAEFLRSKGHAGMIYRSAMYHRGYNIALFDRANAIPKARGLFTVNAVEYSFDRHAMFPEDYEGEEAPWRID